jgi:putative ABC transport system permease protein
MIKDYFSLAFENLKHRGLRSWLTILGIFIGIAAVVALISLGNGLQTAITGQFGSLSLDRLTIQNKGVGFGPPGSTVIEKLNNHDVQIIESVQGVDLVVTSLIRVVKIEYNEISKFNYITDVPSDREKQDFFYSSSDLVIDKGRQLEAGDTGKIIIGSDIVDDFEKELDLGKKITIQGKDFEIIGIFEKSSSFQLNSVYFMLGGDLEEILGIENEYDIIEAQITDMDEIERVAKNIEDKLRRDRNEEVGEESFSVETPLESLESVNSILNIVNIIITGIAAISLFVGGVGIANTMYTSVLERRKEIGVMKAIGAQNKDILYVFLIESGLLGLVGGLIGAGIGLGFAIAVSEGANSALGQQLITVSVSYPLLIGAISFSFFVGIVSGVLPAVQASKLNVVDSLRS